MRAEFRLVLHDNLADGYELSTVLLAKAGFDGTLQLLTPGWERVLGFERMELNGKTLQQLMWSDGCSGAAAAEAILDTLHTGPVVVRLRCRDGLGKSFRLHRLHDRQEHMIYIVAEEMPQDLTGVIAGGYERRAAGRRA